MEKGLIKEKKVEKEREGLATEQPTPLYPHTENSQTHNTTIFMFELFSFAMQRNTYSMSISLFRYLFV